MIKLEEKEVFLYLDDTDLKVIEQELTDLRNSFQRDKRVMTEKYYLEGSKTILLLVYWDEEEVATYRFETVQGKSSY